MHTAEGKEPYPGFGKEAQAHAARARALRRAAADPLPGPLADAFGPLPETVSGLRVRPVVHYDFVVLRALKSPLLDHLAGASNARRKPASPFSDDQGYEMVLQFTTPPEQLADLMDQHGPSFPKWFRRQARQRIGFRLGPVQVALLVKLVEQAFIAAFKTVLEFTEKPSDNAPFTSPPAPSTASAGGSTTSAASSGSTT
ncbi:MAG TPA: hypothetical protein PKI20_05895 [Verrucomicrobiota bacterium]|nr:hypothetical protein [Verrucomicrobiota bacterium]HQL77166.1 hypothetical protein [Verrucomicrobiota bacterium]